METVMSILILAGCFFALIAAIGVNRFPDCYCRLHAATKAGAFGGSLLAISVGLWFGSLGVWLEVIVLLLLFYTTMPVSAHLLARASRKSGIPPTESTSIEALENFERSKDE